MNKKIKQLLLLLFLSLLLSLPYFVFAATTTGPLEKMKSVADSSYEVGDGNALMTYVGNIIAVGLSVLGIVFIALIIYSGFTWMTAIGNADDIKKAKTSIKTSIIGLVVIISAYAIWKFIATYFL